MSGTGAAAPAPGHVIVTGATGFIGAACVREFLARGWSVTAVGHRRPAPRRADRGFDRLLDLRGRDGLALTSASITDGDDIVRILSERIAARGGGCRALVHCAGRATDVGWDRRFRSVNLEGVENVCRCVRELGIGRLVQMSTTDVYGVKDFAGADERTPLENNRRNPYPKYKILAEERIRAALPRDRYVILRPALVWGPGDTTVLPRAVSFLRAAPVIIYFGRWRGRNRWPLAYVGNVARAAVAAAVSDGALGEAYNVVDPEPTTMDGYYRLLIRICLPGRAGMRSVTVPFAAAWPAAALSTGLSKLFGRDRPLFDPSLYSLHHVSHSQDFDGAKTVRLMRECGFDLVDHATAEEELRAWMARGSPRKHCDPRPVVQ